VFQTRNFQGSRKMSRWPKRSKSWRRGFKMWQDSLDQRRNLPRKVSIWNLTPIGYYMLDVMGVCKGKDNISGTFFYFGSENIIKGVFPWLTSKRWLMLRYQLCCMPHLGWLNGWLREQDKDLQWW
jgi:hypothetical protein